MSGPDTLSSLTNFMSVKIHIDLSPMSELNPLYEGSLFFPGFGPLSQDSKSPESAHFQKLF